MTKMIYVAFVAVNSLNNIHKLVIKDKLLWEYKPPVSDGEYDKHDSLAAF